MKTKLLAIIKTVLLLGAGFALAGAMVQLAHGQSTLNLSRQAPPQVSSVGAASTNPQGSGTPQTLYYWVVARYPIGRAVPTGPVKVSDAPAVLDATHFVTVSWNGVSGATGYDVIRNTSASYPEPCAACAVVLNTGTTTAVNNGGALLAYPPAGVGIAGPATFNMTLNNQDFLVPIIQAQLSNSSAVAVGLLGGAFTLGNCLKMNADGTIGDAGTGCGASSFGNQAANTVFSGPTSGPPDVPSFKLSNVISGTTLIGTPCSAGPALFDSTTGKMFSCQNGFYALVPSQAAAVQLYFFVNSASGISTYKNAVVLGNYTPAAKATLTTVVTGTVGVGAWISAAGLPGTTAIPAGSVRIHIHADRLATGSGTVSVTPSLYTRTSGGVETLVTILESTGTLGTAETEYDLVGIVLNPVIITSTDRVLVKFNATATGTRTVELLYDGIGAAETYSRVELPTASPDVFTFLPYVGATQGVAFGAFSQTSTDIVTPVVLPVAGDTKWYTKGGSLCALSPANVETCTGASVATPNSLMGTYDTLVATACNGANRGQLGIVTTGIINQVRCNGSSWDAFAYGAQVTPPLSVASYTQVNAGSVLFQKVNGVMEISSNADAGGSLRFLAANLPGATHTLTASFYPTVDADGGGYPGSYFLGIYDGTKAEVLTWQFDPNRILYAQLETWTTTSSGRSVLSLSSAPYNGTPAATFRIVDNGATRKFFVAFGNSYVFREIYSEATNTFLTPTQYIFGVYPGGTGRHLQAFFWHVAATTP